MVMLSWLIKLCYQYLTQIFWDNVTTDQNVWDKVQTMSKFYQNCDQGIILVAPRKIKLDINIRQWKKHESISFIQESHQYQTYSIIQESHLNLFWSHQNYLWWIFDVGIATLHRPLSGLYLFVPATFRLKGFVSSMKLTHWY